MVEKHFHSIATGLSIFLLLGFVSFFSVDGMAGSESGSLNSNQGNLVQGKQFQSADEARTGTGSFFASLAGCDKSCLQRSFEFSFLLTIDNSGETGKETRKGTLFIQKGHGKKGSEGWRIDSKGGLGDLVVCRNNLYRIFYSADDRKYYMRNIDSEESFGGVLLTGLPLLAGRKWAFIETLSAPWASWGNGKFVAAKVSGGEEDSPGKCSSGFLFELKRNTTAYGKAHTVNKLPVPGGTEKIELLFLHENTVDLLPERIRYLDAGSELLSEIIFSRENLPGGRRVHASVRGAPGQPGLHGDLKIDYSADGLLESFEMEFIIDENTSMTLTMSINWMDKKIPELFRFHPPAGSRQLDALDLVDWLLVRMEKAGIQ